MMSEAEIAALVDAVVAELGASSPKDMGKCMGALQVGVSNCVLHPRQAPLRTAHITYTLGVGCEKRT